MQKRLLLSSKDKLLQLAVMEDGELMELYTEQAGSESLVGNIYLGRIDNVLPGMHAAFVDIGLDKNGMLSLSDIAVPEAKQAIEGTNKPLKPGNEIIVQVFKQPGGEKGVRLTCHISLPGKTMVLMPTVHYIGISKKITDDDERARLRAIANELCESKMGLIIRTAAEGMVQEELYQEAQALIAQWNEISSRAQYAKPPKLLHENLNLAQRAARDMLLPDVEELIVDDPAVFAQIEQPMVRLHSSEIDLFTLHRVESQIEKAQQRRVWLDCGGYIVIDKTEAMTVIDVNTGKFVGKNNIDETMLKINCEAAVEIAKQLRLRDIGGIIIIDFIDMESSKCAETLLETFANALKRDRSKTNLHGMTKLGLVEMTRKKMGVGSPLNRAPSKEKR
ncbi:Rne/Rng family ribonuclease [Eubacteriales bacterium OttesenSCG-928-N13]|nr:Rne/Rng family ribonuclease [Eubacteriales bacterium OttesenSCG-928-N13]